MKKCMILLLSAVLAFSLAACQINAGNQTGEQSAVTTVPSELPHQHSYVKTVTDPTCVSAGYATYTCDCGHSYLQDLVDPSGHSYADTVVAPTADARGYTEHTCTACGDVYKDAFVDSIDNSHKHRYVVSKNVDPGCVTIGYTVYTCSCGDSYMDNLINATGHSYAVQVVPPTAGIRGYTEHTCTACGDVYTDTFIEALPVPHQHQYIEVEVFAPDCIAEGCSLFRCECGDEFYGRYTAVVDHDYVSTVVAPDHTSEGFTDHRCRVCGDWYRDTFVDRTPEHAFTASDVIAPTCSMEGFTLYSCDCGEFYTQDHVPATGHHYTAETVVEPTYDAGGYTVYVCADCGDTYHGDHTDKLQPEEDEPSSGHVCSGDNHEEIQQGGYTYVYCDTIESPYLSEDGFTVYYPYEYYF